MICSVDGMTSVTAELDVATSPLRRVIQPYSELIQSWRKCVVEKLPHETTVPPVDRTRVWLAAHAIDYRIRWWLSGVDSLPDVVQRGLRLAGRQRRRRLTKPLQPSVVRRLGRWTQVKNWRYVRWPLLLGR